MKNPVPQIKTKTWILLLAAVFVILAGLAAWQYFGAKTSARAEIWVDGVLERTVDLSEDQTFVVETDRGRNRIQVKDGRISVVAASCPDGDCIRCGAKNSGAPIVCLPNRLMIRFSESGDTSDVDGVVR